MSLRLQKISVPVSGNFGLDGVIRRNWIPYITIVAKGLEILLAPFGSPDRRYTVIPSGGVPLPVSSLVQRVCVAIVHRLCRLIWKILHDGVRYEERGPAVTKKRAQARAAKMIRELRSIGYRVELVLPQAETPA
jgi:hypothetical protein